MSALEKEKKRVRMLEKELAREQELVKGLSAALEEEKKNVKKLEKELEKNRVATFVQPSELDDVAMYKTQLASLSKKLTMSRTKEEDLKDQNEVLEEEVQSLRARLMDMGDLSESLRELELQMEDTETLKQKYDKLERKHELLKMQLKEFKNK
jgi:chromosome segregation ATPase